MDKKEGRQAYLDVDDWAFEPVTGGDEPPGEHDGHPIAG